MTCKDCYHERVCDALCKNGLPYADGELPAEAFCMEFKNKKEVAKVVRCGECVYWKLNPHNLHGGYCRHCDGASIDHYCSYGKKKQ